MRHRGPWVSSSWHASHRQWRRHTIRVRGRHNHSKITAKRRAEDIHNQGALVCFIRTRRSGVGGLLCSCSKRCKEARISLFSLFFFWRMLLRLSSSKRARSSSSASCRFCSEQPGPKSEAKKQTACVRFHAIQWGCGHVWACNMELV